MEAKDYLLKYLEKKFPCRVFEWDEQENSWSTSDMDVIEQVKLSPKQVRFVYEIVAEMDGMNHELSILFDNNWSGIPFVNFKVKEL